MSSCIVDQAQATEELFLELNLKKQRDAAKQQQTALGSPGVCLNCGERNIDPEGRYCDEDCRKDHEKRLQARARSGRI